MPSLPLSDADVQAHTTGGSYERGRQYLENGAVQSLTLEDEHTLKANVQGSALHPYIVRVRFDEESVTHVECTCPYHEGSWCKHIAAVLLKALETDDIPKSESAAVADLVTDLDRDGLVELLARLVEHDPGLLDQIERARSRVTKDD